MCGRYLFDPDWDEPDDDMEEDGGAGGAGVIIREIVRKYANDPAFAGAVRKPAGDPAVALAGEIFPGTAVSALVGDFSCRNAELIYWGFPFPGKPFARQIINARSETLLEKQMFARLTRNSRCLVPANAFYEWSAAEADRGGDVSGLTGKVGTVRGLTGKRGVGGAKRKTK
ncbi:MAG: SOS response-associated peptidase [Clostridiales bacterium]|jgi:hypothetical protein|nr:SOS response-associated peptidase [Clostridiales bacterium]